MFALFFLAEYSNMLLMSAIMIILFLGGWLIFWPMSLIFSEALIFTLKMIILSYTFIIVRSALPRVRYDQLMALGWKIFLPFTFLYLVILSLILYFTGTFYPIEWGMVFIKFFPKKLIF